jgi:hypothetical protein
MSKSGQQSPASLNLGNQTYDRGVSDGLHGRPKAIKKTHTHAHRYHAGYRHGNEQRLDVRRHRVSEFNNPDGVVIATHGEGAKALKSGGLLSRIIAWIRA